VPAGVLRRLSGPATSGVSSCPPRRRGKLFFDNSHLRIDAWARRAEDVPRFHADHAVRCPNGARTAGIRSRNDVRMRVRGGFRQAQPDRRHFRKAPQRKKKRGRGQVRVHGPSSRSVASTRRGGAGSLSIYPIRSASQMVPTKERENPRAGMELRGLSSASVTRHYFLIGRSFAKEDYNPESFPRQPRIPTGDSVPESTYRISSIGFPSSRIAIGRPEWSLKARAGSIPRTR
jgi:hypothetical protein